MAKFVPLKYSMRRHKSPLSGETFARSSCPSSPYDGHGFLYLCGRAGHVPVQVVKTKALPSHFRLAYPVAIETPAVFSPDIWKWEARVVLSKAW